MGSGSTAGSYIQAKGSGAFNGGCGAIHDEKQKKGRHAFYRNSIALFATHVLP
jgi:hypothetical protein